MSESTSLVGEISLEEVGDLRDEEPINAATHSLGCLLSAGATVAIVLLHAAAGVGQLLATLVFTVSLTTMYAVSALSHAVNQPRRKYLLRAWDQGVIYLLIVATYTPFLWKYAPFPIMVTTLFAIWLAAIVGCISKVVYLHRVDDRLSPVSYIALGWVPALAVCYCVPWACLQWIALGGVLYTVGVFFLSFDRRVAYFHTVWHVSVIAASGCHFYAIYQFVLMAP